MKTELLRVVLLAAALVACGCTNKEIEGPDETGAPDNNAAPVADAGADQTVAAGAQVTLTGNGSDADGTVTNYNWSQTGGSSVTLDTDGQNAGFTAPQVEQATALVFELRVTDDGGAGSESDSVTVTVLPVYDKFLGTAVEQPEDLAGPLTTYFSQVTPGNAGKWGSVEGTRDIMDWTNLDNIHTYAENQGLLFKQHTLFWGQQQPDWLAGLSVEEQSEEINEWLEALATKYGDLDMIDVVNEPLHAPPAYREALGGEGESGWDWLINAFKLAREHFPESTLILNDYNILNLEENTEDYLMVVRLLQDLELIDGIGVQAHFLEQTSAATVKANLDLLGATGLPIYVSEFDVNFADDARHANKLAELFTVFWEHPAVAGVTHWGYREGAVWREDAWLLNSDGTERPGLAWLRCYAVDGNDDCTLPEYVPAGWAGDESGVVLEAELFDKGEGVAASGSIIHNVDLGDWISFTGVEFQEGWDGLKVRYAKGEGETGRISVRLGCGDNVNDCAEVASVPLPPTGGWGDYRTIDIPWEPMDGSHDVFLRFMDVSSVGNIDWLRFGPTAVVQVNLVEDGGFEGDSIDPGWSVWYTAEGALALTDMANSGSQGMSLTGRTNAGANRASYDLTDKVETGETYPVSAWVAHSGPDAARVTLSYKLRCNDVPDGDSTYHGIDDNSEVPADEWTELSGELAIPADCSVINEVRIYFENTPLDVETLYYDDVEVLGWGSAESEPEETDNLVSDGAFEGGSLDSDWGVWYTDGTTIELSSEQFQVGTQSLKVSNRAENSNPSYDLTGKLENGQQYTVSAWVFHTGAEAQPVIFSAKLACAEGDEYPRIFDGETEDPLPANEWVKLEGELSVPEACDLSSSAEARIYFEGTPLEVNLFIDDVKVLAPTAEPSPAIVEDGDFEGDSLSPDWSGWWDGGGAITLALSSEQFHSGTQSLKVSGRDNTNTNPSYNLSGKLEAGKSYDVSAWVYHTGPGDQRVQFNAKLEACPDPEDPDAGLKDIYPSIENNTAVPANQWTQLSGTLDVSAECELSSDVRIYFEQTPLEVETIYIDEVSVAEQ